MDSAQDLTCRRALRVATHVAPPLAPAGARVPGRFAPVAIFCLAGLLAAGRPVHAADLAKAAPAAPMGDGGCASEGWRFRLTPYAWAISINGDAVAYGRNVNIDASFTDTVKNSDTLVALEGYGEARYGCLGVFADLTYIKTTYSDDISNVGVAASNVLTISQGGVLLEVLRLSGPDGKPAAFTVDAMAGVRHISQTIDLDVSIVPNLPLEKGYAFTDAIVGLRSRYRFAPQWEFQAWGNVGAGGSNFSWEAGAAFGYTFNVAGYDLTSLIGYRGMGYDYSGKWSDGINQTLHGPVLGLSMRF